MSEAFFQLDAAFPWLFPAFAFVFGAMVGSFLNVVIYRVPAGKSIVFPGSHCYNCGTPIAWYDNIPIASWFLLRGRARCCGAPFSPRYAGVEALTGFFFLVSFLQYRDTPLVALAGFVFVAFLIAGTFIDLDHLILPDFATVGGVMVGLVVALLVPKLHLESISLMPLLTSMQSLIEAVIGLLVGSAIIAWIRVLGEIFLKKEAMGEGDIYWMGCIGAFCGWQGAIFAIFGGAMVACVVIIPMMIFQMMREQSKAEEPVLVFGTKGNLEPETHRAGSPPPENKGVGFGVEIPFGPWLAAGAAIYFFLIPDLVDAYFAQAEKLFTLPVHAW